MRFPRTPELGRLTNTTAAGVGSQLAYLNRLCERMNRLGFAPFDSVFQASLNARNAVHDLHVAIHYAGVKHGVAADADECKNSRRVTHARDSIDGTSTSGQKETDPRLTLTYLAGLAERLRQLHSSE